MAERMNIAYFSETEEILWGERWGGNSIWEYIIYGADYIIDIVKDPKFLTSKLETGLDGAMLIDASQKNVIFDAHACTSPSFEKNVTNEEKVKYNELDDKISYFFNTRNDEFNPIFIDFLIDFARVSWSGWSIYFARYTDFLEQGKIERDISKIQSLNYHKAHVHQVFPDYPTEDFPYISVEEILWFLQMHFYHPLHHRLAIENINNFKRGLHE